jgi:FtsH-binding integral membrane protein
VNALRLLPPNASAFGKRQSLKRVNIAAGHHLRTKMHKIVALAFLLFQIIAVIIPNCLWAEDAESDGMIMIEIVEDPSFFEMYHTHIYILLIVIFLGVYFWRRYQQGKHTQ